MAPSRRTISAWAGRSAAKRGFRRQALAVAARHLREDRKQLVGLAAAETLEEGATARRGGRRDADARPRHLRLLERGA